MALGADWLSDRRCVLDHAGAAEYIGLHVGVDRNTVLSDRMYDIVFDWPEVKSDRRRRRGGFFLFFLPNRKSTITTMQSAPPIALRLLSHTAPLPRCSTSTLTALAARRSFATKASAAVAWSATGQRPAQPLPCTCSALPRRAQLSTRAGSLQASEQIAARTLSVRGQVARSRVLQVSKVTPDTSTLPPRVRPLI